MKDLMDNLFKAMGEEPPTGGEAGDEDLSKLIGEFQNFFKEAGNDPKITKAMDEVVDDLLNKDVLYEPLVALKNAYPEWLEANWERLPEHQVDMYNKQLDKVEEICRHFEDPKADKQKIFDYLGELQELGDPPADMMEKLGQKK